MPARSRHCMMERAGMMPLAGANTGRSDAAGTAGKAPERDEIEPGYLPVRQSPFDLRAIGRGFILFMKPFSAWREAFSMRLTKFLEDEA